MKKVDNEEIESFLEGRDPQKYIVGIEAGYSDNKVYLIIDDPETGKRIERHKLRPFVWARLPDIRKLYKGDRKVIRERMAEFGIKIDSLNTEGSQRLEEGFKYIVHCSKTYNDLINFFRYGGINIFGSPDFISLSPAEQFLIQSGKRLFKGIDDYQDIHRFVFDLETTGLDPYNCRIFQVGMKDNRGFNQVIGIDAPTEEEMDRMEREAIMDFFKNLSTIKPSIIAGYNSENFDWNFFFKRCEVLNLDITKIGKTLNPKQPILRKESTLKLGAEVERYEQTIMWGYNITDTYHAVRRAQAINSSIKGAGLKYITKYSGIAKPNRVYVQGDKIHKIWNENKDFYFWDSDGSYYEVEKHKEDEGLKEGWEIVKGRYIIERYLLDDLWETEEVDNIFNQATFLLAKIIPSTFARTSTMGTAAIWKLLMLAWSYEKDLAIPAYQQQTSFTGGLSRLLKVGFGRNIVKLDFASLYPSIQLTHDVFPECDVTGAMKGMLQYVYDKRNLYKELKNKAEAEGNSKLAGDYDKKQLPLKILNNSMFGSVSAPNVFPWGDMRVGEQITCTGRQYLRHMVIFFMSKGFEPTVLDTDGVNFVIPENADQIKYIGKGIHRMVKKDKEYTGCEAVVAEYNELYMQKVMGLDIDEYCKASINLARKNYANLIPGKKGKKDKIKLVGNTIKSKKLPTYIEEFLDKGIKMLLAGDGKEFIEYYYEYAETIYNMEIPLSKIASKAKVKMIPADYIKRCKQKNKNGKPLPKQAHMELLLREGRMDVSLGDVIYYVNVGSKKSHGDIKAVKNKQTGETTLEFNCKVLDNDLIENNPDQTGEYNVPKYLSAFNTRIKPLLVCFSPEIRDQILINNPEDRQFFTEKQLQLTAGFPFKPTDQDTIEELLTISEGELAFWERMNKSPHYMWDTLNNPEETEKVVEEETTNEDVPVSTPQVEESVIEIEEDKLYVMNKSTLEYELIPDKFQEVMADPSAYVAPDDFEDYLNYASKYEDDTEIILGSDLQMKLKKEGVH